jgi:hypothetical protein
VLGSLLAGVPAGLKRTSRTEFSIAEGEFEVGDDALADFLEALVRHAPARLPLAPFAPSPFHGEAILQLVNRGIIELHSLPFPGSLEPGEHPRTNPLIRAMIARGETRLFTLDHRVIAITEEGPRQFLSLLDGQRDRTALAEEWQATGMAGQTDVDAALHQLARAGLLSE